MQSSPVSLSLKRTVLFSGQKIALEIFVASLRPFSSITVWIIVHDKIKVKPSKTKRRPKCVERRSFFSYICLLQRISIYLKLMLESDKCLLA